MYLKKLHTKFGSKWLSGPEKISFNFHMLMTFGQRNDLDLEYLHTFIYSIRCHSGHRLQWFLKIPLFSHPIEKQKLQNNVTKFDLVIK